MPIGMFFLAGPTTVYPEIRRKATTMQTYSLNHLAEQFEVDRSTMLKAMRNIAPDIVKRGNRPEWRVASAAKALEAHRRKADGNITSGDNPALQALYAEYDAAEKAMAALPTLAERREAARATAPLIRE